MKKQLDNLETEQWLNIGPLTMKLDETKWDLIPPMSRTLPGGVPGQLIKLQFEAGPLDCIIILLKNDHQHRRRVTFPPSRKICRKWVRLQSPELPRGSLDAESSVFMVVKGVPSP